ncbi:hypothetical protein J1786_02420 [Rahnella sp. L72c]|uniref:Conjugal transfer entry exclusion protein TraS n=1 Tax=Rahnella perminowiae TaxID=2816244 RepID=A0ABS6KWF8_9GAMM|nr:hypothetical protein [Rahnella perminowiae]MBU9833689.1 hypothetical protein [Rahnella perminowiae]
MNMTNKMIKDDVAMISSVFLNHECEVPPFWKCMRLGLSIFVGVVSWQTLFALTTEHFSGGISIFFAVAIGFIIILSCFGMSAKYYSLPEEIRGKSIVIRFMKTKIKHYALFVVSMYVIFTLGFRMTEFFFPVACIGFLFVTSIITFMIFLADMGRYDLSLFNAAISAWRGEEPDGTLKKTE